MKYLLSCLLVVLSVFCSCSTFAQAEQAVLLVDGKFVELTQMPEIRLGDVLVWVGDLVKLGWVTIVDNSGGKLVLKHDTMILTFEQGSRLPA